MTTLISSEEFEETDSIMTGDDDDGHNDNVTSDTIRAPPIKLLLIRTPWFIIGLVVLVAGVVLSQYRIHLPYEAECDDDNFTNSTTPTSAVTDHPINHTVSFL